MAPSGVSTLLEAVKKGLPDILVKRRLNFITIHYLYICGMAIFWSAIFYAIGGVPYVDALFFASGGSTQSGLNTIDVNLLKTGQQALLYFLAMMCNPIVIHSSLVFVRLYWFEKRFKDVVREARQLRRTRSKSRQRRGSFLHEDTEAGRSGVSVRGRAIQLLQSTGHRADGRKAPQATSDVQTEEKHVDSSDTSQDQPSETSEKPSQRRSASLDDVRLPQQMNAEQHIRFLENQRNPQDSTTLRIPSPREFDRGGRVQSIDETPGELGRQSTRIHGDEMSPDIAGAPRVAQHITFNEPDVPAHQRNPGRVATLPRVETGKASTIDPRTYDEDPMLRGRSHTRRNSGTFLRTNTARTMEAAPYLSWQPTVARNSFFVNLTEEQREELGGIEYRSLKTLALILLGYFICFHLFGIIAFTPWIYTTHYGSSVTAVGQGRTWWGIFTAQSIFNDLGYTLTPDSMNQFQTSSFVMLLGAYLIIIGNTGFPCMLRCVIWVISKCVPVGSGLWEELQFLLDHPRRCFTLLFPRAATWWLFAILVILNGVDLLLFIILDLNDDTVTHLSPWTRITVGLFQASATRTAGFSAVNLADLHAGVQVSYMIMMYISAFPIAISMRRTNVYEEKSLGIYAGASDENSDDAEPSYVGAHVRKQLGFDLWYVVLGLFLIAIVEGGRIGNNNEYAFTLWAILFEIISAYGTVGLSMGYPGYNTSFSGQFKTLSKLVIIAMQIRGRHRGLPYELDRAVLLPSEGLHRKEAQEGDKILQRRRTSLSQYDTNPTAPRQGPNGALASTTSHDHAVDGVDERGDEDHIGPRQRRLTNQSTATSTGSQGEKHRRGRLHRGLGNAVFKVAGPEEVIDEEAEKKPT